MKRFVQAVAWLVIGAGLAFLLLERPWLAPEEKTDEPGTPWSTYFMGEQ